jgi:hypothetical protein
MTARNIIDEALGNPMKRYSQQTLMMLILFLMLEMIKGSYGATQEFDMKGWGMNDPYQQYYDINKFEKLRAWVVGFKTEPPMPGMSPATMMVVKDGRRLIDVHICPTWFAKPGEVGVKKGDRVKIKGCRAEVAGKEVFIASKVKKYNYFEFKVRLTKNGKPYWTLTPEELIRELQPEDMQ